MGEAKQRAALGIAAQRDTQHKPSVDPARRGFLPMEIPIERSHGKETVTDRYLLHPDGTVYLKVRGALRRVKDRETLEMVGKVFHERQEGERFSRMISEARKRGWSLPSVFDRHPRRAWMAYWAGMEAYEAAREADPDAQPGRPVPPHTPGSAVPQ